MFVGWEGVGLCSYLLIGFYYKQEVPPVAGMKAFLVNRIGDFGFLLGMLLILLCFGSLRYTEVFERAAASPHFAGSTMAMVIALLLFVGATGKSAQLPLFTWLPDAMAGPTPVSALIHAATMVTAGVFMIIRSNVIFQASPDASLIVAIVGGATAFFAATIALVQNDLKKILAYSTVSQLGYMFLAVGVGAYTAGLFHLVTHAFFKALLFLGAGSVSHGLHGELDVRKMGGLKSVLPQTQKQMLIACLAIAGIPILAGFWSKDEILTGVLAQGAFAALPKILLYGGGILTAVMTAFYMFRLYYLTFEGEPRWDEGVHPHEAPPLMTGPLWVLAGLSALGGFIGFAPWTHLPNWLHHALQPVLHHGTLVAKTAHFAFGPEMGLVAVATAAAFTGMFWARAWYKSSNEAPARMAKRYPKLHALALAKWRVDEIYNALIVTPFHRLCDWAGTFDRWVVDGLVEGTGVGATLTGEVLRHVSSGRVRTYALAIFIGAVGVACWLLVQ
jgi:NADH-quinone oxidoreductase subunit L